MKLLYRISILLNVIFLLGFLLFFGWKEGKTKPEPVPKLQTVSSKQKTASCDTTYQIFSYDKTTGREENYEEKLPSSYIGKTRGQIISLIDSYNLNPGLSEKQKGFLYMELSSFSREKICVRKIYESNPYYCCIYVEDGYLSVYDEKHENVILYTDIAAFKLPKGIQDEVFHGKYFETEDELYNFLESYSS